MSKAKKIDSSNFKTLKRANIEKYEPIPFLNRSHKHLIDTFHQNATYETQEDAYMFGDKKVFEKPLAEKKYFVQKLNWRIVFENITLKRIDNTYQ